MTKYNTNIFTTGTITYSDLDISFKSHPFTGDLRTVSNIDSIKQSLKTLLYTKFGERPFRPNLGTKLGNLLFKQLDQITKIELDTEIRNVIQNWEPRININDLQINDKPDDNAIEIALIFSMLNISEPIKIDIILHRTR